MNQGQTIGRLGWAAAARKDWAEARLCYQEALAFYRRLRDRRQMAVWLAHLGYLAIFQGHFARATELCTESLALARAVGYKEFVSRSLTARSTRQGIRTAAAH